MVGGKSWHSVSLHTIYIATWLGNVLDNTSREISKERRFVVRPCYGINVDVEMERRVRYSVNCE